MNLSKLVASDTFRWSLVYITGLSVTVCLITGIIYAVYSYRYTNEVHDTISSEFLALSAAYTSGGIPAVERFVTGRGQDHRYGSYYYLVVDERDRPLAGNLARWPTTTHYPWGWLSFEIDYLTSGGDKQRLGTAQDYVGRWEDLQHGGKLLVARLYNDVTDRYFLVGSVLGWSTALTILLGGLGGAVITRLYLNRLENINRSIERIMAGDLSARLRMLRGGGDFETLVMNLNHMLDRIESLMEGTKQVTDNIAHDLRTPLSRMRRHLDELLLKSPPELEENVLQLADEADALLRTFNALLRIARIEADSLRSGFAKVDVGVIIADVVELYEPLAAEEEQHISARVEPAIILADRDLLFQAVANLVDNAIKYAGRGGLIEVTSRLDRGTVEIVVADNGPGIPPEEREKVFRRFYRLEQSRGQVRGNGLGLSLVAAVVKLHQGSVRLEDNQPGLRVVIRFPRGMSGD